MGEAQGPGADWRPVGERRAAQVALTNVQALARRHPDLWISTDELMARDADDIRSAIERALVAAYPVETTMRWRIYAFLFASAVLSTLLQGYWPLSLLFVVGIIWSLYKDKMMTQTLAKQSTMEAALTRAAIRVWHEAVETQLAWMRTRRADRGDPGYSTRHPRPEPLPYGVSHEGAEQLVAAWMRHLGDEHAAETQFSGDGGIDVASATHIAQVKNYAGAVPVAAIREFFGVAVADGRTPLFFTSGNYSAGSVEFAEAVGMALFTYDARAGTLTGANGAGTEAARLGL